MKKVIAALVYLSFLVISCVYPLEFVVGNKNEILIIEGSVNDYDSVQFISITRSVMSKNHIGKKAVENCKVIVKEDAKTEFICEEKKPGEYFLPKGFRGKVNSKYELIIRLADGNEYRSFEEELPPVPDIDKIYSVYRPGLTFGDSLVDGHSIYLDTKELPGREDYVFWKWRLFEKQNICITCMGARYKVEEPYNGKCVNDQILIMARRFFDYMCDGNCWEIYNSDRISLISDAFADGLIKGNHVADIPYFENRGALVEIKQHSVNASAYRYLKLLSEQSTAVGSLTDTPPAALVGNVRNVKNKYEGAGGYFLVSSIAKKNFWLDRSNTNGNPRSIQVLGRDPVYEPPGPNRQIPLAPCIPGVNRTNVRQEGWVND